MKKAFLPVVAVLVVASILLIRPVRTVSQQLSPAETGNMGKRVAQLEEKVKSLEAEVAKLKQAQSYFAVQSLPPGMTTVPRDWKKFSYGGQTLYLVPLDRASTPDKNK